MDQKERKLNILILTHQGNVAGSTFSISYLAKGLADLGHNVYCGCPKYSLLYNLLEDTRVELVPLEFERKVNFKLAKELTAFCNNHKIDIVNTQSSLDRYAIILAKTFYGLKSSHVGTRRQQPQSSGGFFVNRLASLKFDRFVTVSRSIKEEMVKKGFPSAKIKVIHNGTPSSKYEDLDLDLVYNLQKKLNIDSSMPLIGSISRRKKQQQIVDALLFLKEPVQVIFVGINEESLSIDKVLTSDVPHRLIFTGTIENSMALNYMKLLDLHVLSSTTEGISQTILEAMAIGIPVIATNAGGNPEIIKDGENGLLFEDGDIAGLASKMEDLLNDEKKREKFSRQGKITALEDFSIEQTIKKYEKFFYSLIS